MSGPWLPSAGRAENASIVPSGEYDAVSPAITTSLMIASADAVGCGSSDVAAEEGAVGLAGEPVGPAGSVALLAGPADPAGNDNVGALAVTTGIADAVGTNEATAGVGG